LVHSDVCGPMQTESIGGSKYFVTFIDDYSRCSKVYFMKQKSEVLCKFKEFEKTFSNECRQRVTRLRTDNGGEYTSKEFQECLKAQGIHHETTVPHTPQQNGVAERKNRTLIEAARTMLSHAQNAKDVLGRGCSDSSLHTEQAAHVCSETRDALAEMV